MQNMTYVSPLRYPGGKGKLAEFFHDVVERNQISTYVEPYFGGGSVGLSLLLSGDVDRIVINDKDRSVYAFWYSVLAYTEELCRMIEDTAVNMDEWRHQRIIQQHKGEESLLSLGFSTFFLNRTNRSGILKAGVIGGQKQDGRYFMDARYNKKDLIGRIQRVASHSSKIILYNKDAVDFLQTAEAFTDDEVLIYLDPPYYVKGEGLYMNYYTERDHRDIAQFISKGKKGKWIITYDNNDFIKSLYPKFRHYVYSLSYHAARPSIGQEVMILSDAVVVDLDMLNK